ncbi:hypothetical protein Nmel_004339, partial [Mimus melanotis]
MDNNAWSQGGLCLVGSGASSWQQFSPHVQWFCGRVTSSRIFECGGTVDLTHQHKEDLKSKWSITLTYLSLFVLQMRSWNC